MLHDWVYYKFTCRVHESGNQRLGNLGTCNKKQFVEISGQITRQEAKAEAEAEAHPKLTSTAIDEAEAFE